ncbi:MAG: hypothetical protein HOV97_05460 [Nonomuraea sp.]|nr:hypothetical protein [Nonomuraea sp.]
MSKTDHARVKGSHRVGHAERAWRKGDAYRLPTRPVLALRDEIVEGLALVAAPIDLGERYVPECTDGPYDFYVDERVSMPVEEALAEWEWELLRGDEGNHATYADYLADHERKAREPRLAWSSDVEDVEARAWEAQRALERYQEREREEEAWDDVPETFLAPVSPRELRDLFPDGGFTIEGPSRDRTSGKADGYLRAYELARLVGINTAHMVEYLRDVHGEWVAGPTAYVALPVCERMVSLADDLQAEYGRRDTPVTWAEQRAAWGFR